MNAANVAPPDELPVDVSDSRSVAWWGMLFLFLAQAAILTSFVVSYVYLGAGETRWPPEGIEKPALTWPIVGTVVLGLTAAPAYWAAASIKEGKRGRALLGLAGAFVLGLVFLGVEAYEYGRQDFDLATHAYASSFLVILAFHAAQTAAALITTLAVAAWTLLGYYDERRNLAIQNAALFWYYVIASWVLVFAVLYASPYAIDM